MPVVAQKLRAPKLAPPDSEDDPYRELVIAILRRAVEDARGHCMYPGNRSPLQIEVEARAWLADDNGAAALVELMGCEAAPIVRRVRQILLKDAEGTA